MSGQCRSKNLSLAWQVGGVGVAAQAVTYGFARYGYGLFLPDFRERFGLSVSDLGLISSTSYAGYLVGLLLVGLLVSRFGPRPMVMAAGLSAGAGMVAVALAQNTWVFVAGLVVAGMASGFSWAPFSDTADRLFPAGTRERVMALVPSGTAFGVAVAGPLALVTHGEGWRYAWCGFAVAALAVSWCAARVLPTGPHADAGTDGQRVVSPRWFVRKAAVPLYLTALSYGLVGAFYWAFALDAVSSATGEDSPVAPLFWTLMGLSGIVSVFAGAFFSRLGLLRAQVVLFSALALSIALLGAAPGNLVAVAASAVLYGPAFMATSALLALWSYRVFREQPSTGFSATVLALGVGTLIGPATLGALADHYSLRAAFLLTAALALATLAFRPLAESRTAAPADGNAAIGEMDSETRARGRSGPSVS